MKKLLTLMLIALVSVSLFAQGGNEKASTPAKTTTTTAVAKEDLTQQLKDAHITLELWHAQTKANGEAMDKVIELFNTTNPYGITVNGTCQGGYGDCHKKIVAALAAGTYPNIGQAYNNNMMTYMPSGKLMDLTDYLNDDYGLTPEVKATIVPSFLDENHAFPDGRTYATSLGKSTEVLFYNKTFVEENGLKIPTTFAELEEVAKQATAITGKPSVGFDSMDNLGIYGPVNFGAKYADVNGHLYMFDKDNLPKAKAFYEYWQRGIAGGYFRTAGEDKYCSGPFSAGNIIFYIGSSAGTAYILPDGFEAAVTYSPVGVNPAVIQQGGNFCGFKTGNELVDLATSIFLEFMYDPEAAALYAANTGYAPSNKASLDLSVYKESIEKGGIGPAAKAVSATYPDGILAYDPVFTNSYETRRALADIVSGIGLDGKADIDTLIKDTIQKIEDL